MKRISSFLLLLFVGLCILTGCSDDCPPLTEPDTPEQPKQPEQPQQQFTRWLLPIERYGITLGEVTQIEKERGNKVDRSDETMTLTATPSDLSLIHI